MPNTIPRTTRVLPRNCQPSQMALATDGAEICPRAWRLGISLSRKMVTADTTKVAALK